jgi:diaminohydroxyphosphoribosylaminopyrimidine deaminase/5-amino-6-(5-phosphoribosylamino)uracil reductase
MVIDPAFYMHLALDAAWRYQGLTYPNPAVGALLLDGGGRILAIEAHQKAGGPHAEVLALKTGFLQLCDNPALCQTLAKLEASHQIHDFLLAHHAGLFKACTLYVTLEPCFHHGKTPPCSRLIAGVGIREIGIGSLDPNAEAAGGAAFLAEKGVAVTTGIAQEACDALLEPFRRWQMGRFVFFKHAQRLNGTIDGGYISADATLDFVHALRERCDLIVIGGNTVRTDRPTLDARRVGGRAPDVLIYSEAKAFDQTIPLFSVPGRRVFVESSLERMNAYRFVMVEGGGAMYEAVKAKIDWHLCLLSFRLGGQIGFAATGSQRRLHTRPLAEDLLIWSRVNG